MPPRLIRIAHINKSADPRLTAAMILSGFAVQVKVLGSLLVSLTKRLMVAWRSMTDRKTLRLSAA
jgi:hypothetical protein